MKAFDLFNLENEILVLFESLRENSKCYRRIRVSTVDEIEKLLLENFIKTEEKKLDATEDPGQREEIEGWLKNPPSFKVRAKLIKMFASSALEGELEYEKPVE